MLRRGARGARARVTTVVRDGDRAPRSARPGGVARRSTSCAAHGVAVAARKPAQSYAPDELGNDRRGDPRRARAASRRRSCARATAGIRCRWRHRWPPTRSDSRPSPSRELVAEIAPAPSAALTFVEGAGGPRSPLATDGDNVDPGAARSDADVVVLVAPARARDDQRGPAERRPRCAATRRRAPGSSSR